MGIKVGDKVKSEGYECTVENVYESEGSGFVCILHPGGYRTVCDIDTVEVIPEDMTKVVRRQAIDRILVYAGTPRDHLYEYPYNERQSDRILAGAEKLLDDLLEVLDFEL